MTFQPSCRIMSPKGVNYMIDVAIIGGGPAAMGAALYAARSGLSVTIFEKKFIGGQAATTYEIDNYLGFADNPSGGDLCMKMQEHVSRFGVNFRYNDVKELHLDGDIKKIITSKKEFEAKSVICAMGATPSHLTVPGESEFSGKGVSYCATCDGNFFKGKTVCVVGGGNTAVEDAIYLSNLASKVYLIHRRDTFRASFHLMEKLSACSNVEILTESKITKIEGDSTVTGVCVEKNGESFSLPTDAVFVAIGITAQTSLVKDSLILENGFIVTDETMATSIEGVFAAGDIRKKPLRQVITAVSDGAIAGEEAAKYVNMHKSSL